MADDDERAAALSIGIVGLTVINHPSCTTASLTPGTWLPVNAPQWKQVLILWDFHLKVEPYVCVDQATINALGVDRPHNAWHLITELGTALNEQRHNTLLQVLTCPHCNFVAVKCPFERRDSQPLSRGKRVHRCPNTGSRVVLQLPLGPDHRISHYLQLPSG